MVAGRSMAFSTVLADFDVFAVPIGYSISRNSDSATSDPYDYWLQLLKGEIEGEMT